MPFLSSSLDADYRRWLLKLVGLLLTAALLANGICLYYAYKVRQLEQRSRLLFEPSPTKSSDEATVSW
ncbi:hypothetical protein [Fibrella aestuarina]|uniref:hypothetical protein n=1 Tax=Fibrella aestuarina TaxID=651143 RepID=UPI000308CC9D|nr:hypothetical protein [Fibrella aestuarina]